MKPTVKSPAKKYQTLEERFIAYSLGGDQRKGKVITDAKDSGQFDSMMKKLNRGY